MLKLSNARVTKLIWVVESRGMRVHRSTTIWKFDYSVVLKYKYKSVRVFLEALKAGENLGHWRQEHMATDRVWFRVRHSRRKYCSR